MRPAFSIECELDLQVNGVGTPDRQIIDFAQSDLDDSKARRAVEIWRSHGTRCFLPTVITAPKDRYRKNLPLLGKAIRGWASRTMVGIHLEGPSINRNDKSRGAHPKFNCHAMTPAEFDVYDEWSQGTIVLVTLAPELPGAMKLIEHLVKRGVVVSLGHHLATPAIIRDAISAGAKCSTHLGNACPKEYRRGDMHLWTQVAARQLAGMFIVDGLHITDEFARTAIGVKYALGEHLPILTSDASPAAKAPPGFYPIFNGKGVQVLKNGWVVVAGEKPLRPAGSGASLMDCMNECLRLGFPREQVQRMARENPWALIGPAVKERLGFEPRDFSKERSGIQWNQSDQRFEVAAAA